MSSFCRKCGTNNATGDNYCSNCGAPIFRVTSSSDSLSTRSNYNSGQQLRHTPPPPSPSPSPSPSAQQDNEAEASTNNPSPPDCQAELSETPSEMNYAGFLQRSFAAFLDYLFFQFTAIACLAIAEEIYLFGNILPNSMAFISVATLLIAWLYHAGLESSVIQGTLGKRMTGIKVTDELGRRCHLGQTTKRFFCKFISALTLGLGFLMMIPSSRNQTLHDKLSGCLVIKR